MACLRSLYSSRLLPLFPFSRILPQFYSRLEVDVMDEFTSRLMQHKVGVWSQKKNQSENFLENLTKLDKDKDPQFDHNISPEVLKSSFQTLFEQENANSIVDLTKICLENKTVLPYDNVINITSICSQQGQKDLVVEIQKMCETHFPQLLQQNSNFRHFLAEAIWRKGDISKGLEIFEEVYRENAYLRRRIRLMFKYLVNDLVSSGSEAALSNTVAFSERICRDYRDFFPLMFMWQACFLSEWYTDQTFALELLEKNEALCKAVINKIDYVVFVSLKCHRTEVVYRLLEILLRNKMKQQYSAVLGDLLDYQFAFGDWMRCSEIIKWAVANDVQLPQTHHIKMINLILSQKLKTPLAKLEKPRKSTKYHFKF